MLPRQECDGGVVSHPSSQVRVSGCSLGVLVDHANAVEDSHRLYIPCKCKEIPVSWSQVAQLTSCM